jgi:hypothetical protein
MYIHIFYTQMRMSQYVHSFGAHQFPEVLYWGKPSSLVYLN